MNNLIEVIKKWIELDNKINKHTEHVKILKENKQLLESHIENYFKTHNVNSLTLSNGNNIVYHQTKQTPGISIKLLNEILDTVTDSNTKNVILETIKRKEYKILK